MKTMRIVFVGCIWESQGWKLNIMELSCNGLVLFVSSEFGPFSNAFTAMGRELLQRKKEIIS